LSITLSSEARKQSLASIRRYVTEHMEEEIGELEGTCYKVEFGYWK
jgi:hypothetical protein